MERLPTPVFWPGEFHGLYSQTTGLQSRTRLSDFHIVLLSVPRVGRTFQGMIQKLNSSLMEREQAVLKVPRVGAEETHVQTLLRPHD